MKKFILALALVYAVSLTPFAQAAISASDRSSLAGTSDLRLGMQGAGVASLQRFLAAETDTDPSIYPSRSATGYFGMLTRAALIRWQIKHSVIPTGAFDAATRKAALGNVLSTNPTDLPLIPAGDVKTGSVDYSETLAAATTVTFSPSDINMMRTAFHGILPVPEILRRLSLDLKNNNSAAAANDRLALGIWQSYFERSYAAVSATKVPVNVAASQRHLLQWFAYNKTFLASTKTLQTSVQASAAYNTYQKVYSSNQAAIQNSFLSKEAVASLKRPSFLASAKIFITSLLFPHASAEDATSSDSSDNKDEQVLQDAAKEIAKQALISAVQRIFLMPVGGSIAITDVCLSGELLTIEGSAPGQVFLYWVVYALNPFPYRAVVDGNQMLGMAFRYPGVCTHSGEDYEMEGQGFMLYFGTSKTPAG